MLAHWKTRQRWCWRHARQLIFINKTATHLKENTKAFHDKESANEDQSNNLSIIWWLTGKRHDVLERIGDWTEPSSNPTYISLCDLGCLNYNWDKPLSPLSACSHQILSNSITFSRSSYTHTHIHIHTHTHIYTFLQANCYPFFRTQLDWWYIQACKHSFNNTGNFLLSPTSPS